MKIAGSYVITYNNISVSNNELSVVGDRSKNEERLTQSQLKRSKRKKKRDQEGFSKEMLYITLKNLVDILRSIELRT